VILAVIASATVVLVACAPESRYRTLSFFFDGVPPPPGLEHLAPEQPSNRRASAFQAAIAALPEREEVRSPTRLALSVHAPVRERRCRECHGSGASLEEIPRDASLCDKCHLEQRQAEGWDHGPINLGVCIPCHRSHDSEYEHLLDRPIPDLCLVCHEEDKERGAEYHQVANIDQCTECHDPHRMY